VSGGDAATVHSAFRHAERIPLVVIGSTMIDLVVYTGRVPAAGETLVGDRFEFGFGGKGANQAVMARLLGAEVTFINRLGDDANGTLTRENLAAFGISDEHIRTSPGVASGVAQIWVEPDGTNRIIIVPGANDDLTADEVELAVAGSDASVVLGQLEVPQAATAAGFRAARARGATTLLNPAPAAELTSELLEATDWLLPNETEFALLSGGGDPGLDADLCDYAARAGVRLLVTLGAAGVALVETDGTVRRLPAPSVTAVDTTGAGDAFVGSFATVLAAGHRVDEAIAVGSLCASDSVTRPGTQKSFPDAERAAELLRSVIA
jgi:ribokinase